ncbi:hypothetical protein Hdeb2414_s0526g00911001 [Helianthus debilis subsp. tardiflorus]
MCFVSGFPSSKSQGAFIFTVHTVQLNSGPRHPGVIGDRGSGCGSISRERNKRWSSQERELTGWLDQNVSHTKET